MHQGIGVLQVIMLREWLMMQHKSADDWVLATGETHTVKEFLKHAFGRLNLEWEKYVDISEKYFRPNEVEYLLGDYSKAEKELGGSQKPPLKNW